MKIIVVTVWLQLTNTNIDLHNMEIHDAACTP